MANCVLVLLWHSLEMAGSYTGYSLDSWWELASICGSALVASAAGTRHCLLAKHACTEVAFFCLEKDGMHALHGDR